MSMDFINYGPQIKKSKRWYPEHRKNNYSGKGLPHKAVTKDEKVSQSEVIDICRVRTECELSCIGCKFYKTPHCTHKRKAPA